MVYVIFSMGWVRVSSYSVLGRLRSSSQLVAYEIVIFLIVLLVVIYNSSWSFMKIDFNRIYLLDVFIIWLMIILVETNRSPFDFAEGERELVSGFNIEYGAVIFAFIFISEYGIIIVFSWLTRVFFIYGVFFLLVILYVVLVRGFIPRSRYDISINICWKFLFILLSILFLKVFIL